MAGIPEPDGDEMSKPKCFALLFLGVLFLAAECSPASSISLEGAPSDIGFNVGSAATIRATVRGITGDASRYAVFADIQYVGAATVTSVEMDRQVGNEPQELRYEAAWPIPSDAPTGLYSVVVRVEDRPAHKVVATQKLRSFAAYKKIARIARVKLDKTFYIVGEPIQSEVILENLTGGDLKDLRVEFSNANYPWISLFSGEANLSGKQSENPQLALKVLRDHLNLPARGFETIPMMPAGTAAFLQGTQVAVLGAGGPARNEKLPPPEVDQYTIALWNADRTVLYDMQFSERAIVRPPDRDLPKPYSNNFTHSYNSDIDFTKYREFYPPGQISPDIVLDHARTLFRPGDHVSVKVAVKNFGERGGPAAPLHVVVRDSTGKEIHASDWTDVHAPPSGSVGFDAWTIPRDATAGVYSLTLSLQDSRGNPQARATTEIAVNNLPDSLLVFCPHEDDEHSYAGLIRAAVEAGIPVRVVVLTGGDVGACERYYSKPCGPNEAREFGMVRMEETAEALEHMGLRRDKLTFLGLPDGGSGAIWSEHIKASNPFLSIYLATDHAPYENILKPNLPYARDAVIELVKQIILDFRPAMIATAHPDERHVDHRTTNWFVIKACQELLSEKRIDPQTIVLADQAYGAGGFKPAPFHYEKAPVYLSGEAAALKQEMGWIYQSQDGNLNEGMRQTFSELPRQEIHYRILDWQEHAGWNE
jgi:LmbE family N-acetylglucosaminyl deacetylase